MTLAHEDSATDRLFDQLPTVKEGLELAKSHLFDLEAHARELIRERPLIALAAAVAVGYAASRLLVRR